MAINGTEHMNIQPSLPFLAGFYFGNNFFKMYRCFYFLLQYGALVCHYNVQG